MDIEPTKPVQFRPADELLTSGVMMSDEDTARLFHETYERLAPQFGYETRPDTKQFDPRSNNGRLMIEVCRVVTSAQAAELAALRARLAVVEGALKQYADPENWSCSDDEHDHRKGNCCLDVWCLDVRDMNANGYEVAQAALANTDARKETA